MKQPDSLDSGRHMPTDMMYLLHKLLLDIQDLQCVQITFSENKGQNNAMILQRNMLLVYHTLFAVTQAAVIKQGTVLVIASSDGHDPQEVHPVRNDRDAMGIETMLSSFPSLWRPWLTPYAHARTQLGREFCGTTSIRSSS